MIPDLLNFRYYPVELQHCVAVGEGEARLCSVAGWMNSLLCGAIQGKKMVNFYYDGGYRLAEPHCYGVSKDGNELLRAYQISG